MNDTMQPMENLEVCPACSGMVSKEAETCPHCGHPVGADRRHAIWEQRKNEAQDILKSATRQSKNWGLKICNLIWRIPVFFLALIGLGIPAAIILAGKLRGQTP